ncbi:MAG: hypothetical protein IPM54_33275 [Polyangiaceae bacterium]|nr:hypothetical protein [Polyangiaceae bacterium]
MDQLYIVRAQLLHAIGYVPGAVFYVWRGTTTVDAARALEQTVRIAAARSDGAGVLLGVVDTGAPPPEPDVRKALADSLAAGAGFVRASALVFEGEGFRASMVRAVATGLSMLARLPYPHESFSSVSAAAKWLERFHDDSGAVICSAAALEAHMHALRTAPHR